MCALLPTRLLGFEPARAAETVKPSHSAPADPDLSKTEDFFFAFWQTALEGVRLS